MEIKTKLTIMIMDEYTEIEIRDEKAAFTPVVLKVSNEGFLQALGRRGHVECVGEFNGLINVGKTHEHKEFEFEMPKNVGWSEKEKTAATVAKEKCPYGWYPDLHFREQGSFYEKDGKPYARTTIRRWV